MIRVRFAPTPSGPLFVSGARVALANYLFARRSDGHLLLRLDNLDAARCPPIHAEQMMQDLGWIGIEWDDCVRQADRRALYEQAIGRLKERGLLYPCFESAEELRAKQEFRRKRNKPLIYDRAMLKLTPAQREAAEAGGKRPHWRLRLSGRELVWHDNLLGERKAKLSAISDPVLVQADDTPSPMLASVVDDVDTGITHIVRGEDNVASNAIQIELFELLTGRAVAVRFAHMPALRGDAQPAPARRAGATPLRTMRADGVEPGAVTACLAGAGDPRADPPGLPALIAGFNLKAMAAADVDVGGILAVNRRMLCGLEFAEVASRLPPGATERFWLAVRGSLDLLKEARGWWDVIAGTIVPPVVEDERSLLTAAADLLPPEPWDDGVWAHWIKALQSATARSGEDLLGPLRLALTGEDSGPQLAELLPLIGRARAVDRLRIAAA